MPRRPLVPCCLLTFSFALGLSGCANLKKFEPVPLSAQDTAAILQQRTLSSLGIDPRQPVAFSALAQAAMTHHPEVELARREADEARAAILSAGARPNPTVNLLPTRVTPQKMTSPWLASFSLDFPIETAGKRCKRVLQAQQQANAAALRVADTAWQVRAKLRTAWLDLFAAEQRASLLATQLATQEQMVEALDARLKAGESSRGEMMQSRLLLNQTRLLASGAKKSAAEGRSGLASAIGVPAAQLASARFHFAPAMNPRKNLKPSQLRCSAYLERPDVLAALSDYAAAEATLRLEIAKQYPDLRLGPGYEFDQGLNKWSLGFSLTLPVFDRNQGPIAEAEAKRATSAARFQVLEARVAGDLDRALASYRGALEKLQVAGETVTDATNQRDAAQRLLQGGEGDRLSVLAAQVELDAALAGRLDVLVEVQQALAGIEDATRTALEP